MRTFTILVLTQTLSIIGSGISGLAVGIRIYADTGNATPLAVVAFFAMLPRRLFGALAGVLADRYDRRYVMALSDAGQAVATALLLVAFLSGGFRLWHLYATTFLGAAFGIFQMPAFGASVTMLVPDGQRDRANALRQINGPLGAVIAPAIIGAIYGWVGVSGAIAIDLATFAVAIAVVLSAHIPRPERSAEGTRMRGAIWSEMLGGVRYLWERRALFSFTLYTAAIMLLLGGLSALGTPYILARTGSATALGILTSVTYAGGIAGSVLMTVWGGTRPRIHTIIPTIIVFGVFVALNGIGRTALAIGLSSFFGFAATPFILAPTQSLMQTKVAPDVQGRVFAAVDQLVTLITLGTYLVAGPLADRVFEPAVGQSGWEVVAPLVGHGPGAGMGLMCVIGGSLTVLISLAVYALPAIRHMEANLPDHVPAKAAGADA
jgi:DHA3 family macrolide efflux protein-like MFS transporter